MMNNPPIYQPSEIEPRWQERWEADGLYHAKIDPTRPKHYAMVMLPYPSGDLHIGHWYNYAPADARARYMRMHGYNVTSPIGFDAFGLPAENAAIKRGIHPKEWTYANIDHMRTQLQALTVDKVNAAIRKHLTAKDLSIVYITKDAEALEQALLGLAQQLIAPRDRAAQRLLARGEVAGPAGQQAEGRPGRRRLQAL